MVDALPLITAVVDALGVAVLLQRRLQSCAHAARHSSALVCSFDSEDLQAYFNSKPWYNGFIAPKDFDEKILNEYEIANLDLIRAVEGD